MLNAAKTVRKILAPILILTLYLGLFPAMAYAGESEISAAPHQYLSGISMTRTSVANAPGENDVPSQVYLYSELPPYSAFVFDPEVTEYNILIADGMQTGMKFVATLAESSRLLPLNGRFADGSQGNGDGLTSKNGALTSTGKAFSNPTASPAASPAPRTYSPSMMFYNSAKISDNATLAKELPYKLKFVVGTLASGSAMGGTYENVDTYTFNIYRKAALKEFKIRSDPEGPELHLSPAWSDANSAYDDVFAVTALGGTTALYLTAPAVTQTDVKLYFGNGGDNISWTEGKTADGESNKNPASTPYKLDLTAYKPNNDGSITVPFKLDYEGGYEGKGCGVDAYYTLHVSFLDYTPHFNSELQDSTVEKGASLKLSVDVAPVENSPEGAETGTLSYQWYTHSHTEAGLTAMIENAAAADYTPPTNFAGRTYYSCKVTRNVGGVNYISQTRRAAVTVQPTSITPPTFTLQPPGAADYVNEYAVGQTPAAIRFGFDNTLLDKVENQAGNFVAVKVSAKLYRNSTDSVDGAELVASRDDTGYNSALTPPPQEEPGTWYYYVVLNAYSGEYPGAKISADVKSNMVAITFKSFDELVDLEGSGTAASPWLIAGYADLVTLKGLVDSGYTLEGRYAKLTSDITLDPGWEPIGALKPGTTAEEYGKNVNPFSATLDGDGHTVTIAEGGLPLFAYVRDATVKNLRIYGTRIADAGLVTKNFIDYGIDGVYQQYTDPEMITIENVKLASGSQTLKSGFVNGSGSGINNVRVKNCTVESGVVIGYDRTQNSIGSFVGNFNGEITDSVSYADVYGVSRVGGLAGDKGQSMGLCGIYRSAFIGTVTATGDGVGGIMGTGYKSESAPNTPTVTIRNCYAAGSITANDYAGGIFGGELAVQCAWDESAITDNFFFGSITSVGTKKGGVVGYLHSINKKQTIANNYYLAAAAESGIGNIKEIITTAHPQFSVYGIDSFNADAACKAAADSDFSDGTLLGKLNASSTSFKNWIQGKSYPEFSDKPIVIGLTLSGEYKSQYYIGQELDLTGLVLTAHWSNGNKTNVPLTDVTTRGYDKNTRGVQTITVRYGAVEASYTVRVLYDDSTPAEITVHFTLLGAKIHNGSGAIQTLRGGNLVTWIPEKAYKVSRNATVWDVFQIALSEADPETEGVFTWRNPLGYYIEAIYKDGVELAEFTNGKPSGWMYTLNGTHPMLSVSQQYLETNDVIVFHYTDDYTREEGSEKWDTPTAASHSSTLTPKITASNGAASAAVSAADMASAIAALKESGGAAIIIAPEITGTAKKISVELPKSSVSSVASETKADLAVRTPAGSITIPNSALASIASRASGSNVTIGLEAVAADSLSAAQRQAVGDNPVYDISIMSGGANISSFGGGSVEISLPYTLKEGGDPEGVTVWYLNDKGELEKITCSYDKTTGLATFTTAHLSYYVVGYAEVWQNPFTDVKTADWFYRYVDFAVQKGLFNGTSATTFSPNAPMTRAMVVTVLYRLEGEPSFTGTNGFADVKKGEWYTDAVIWANDEGIVKGYGSGLFGTEDDLTREQIAAILYRYAQYKGYDIAAATELAAYDDAADISSWANPAMIWAVAEGLITGRTAAMLAPGGSATRAEVAAILTRFCENIVK